MKAKQFSTHAPSVNTKKLKILKKAKKRTSLYFKYTYITYLLKFGNKSGMQRIIALNTGEV